DAADRHRFPFQVFGLFYVFADNELIVHRVEEAGKYDDARPLKVALENRQTGHLSEGNVAGKKRLYGPRTADDMHHFDIQPLFAEEPSLISGPTRRLVAGKSCEDDPDLFARLIRASLSRVSGERQPE